MKIRKDNKGQDLIQLADCYEWTIKTLPKMSMSEQEKTLNNLKDYEFLVNIVTDIDKALLYQVILIAGIKNKTTPLDLMALSMSYYLIKKQIGEIDSQPLFNTINENAQEILAFTFKNIVQ